ncbi:bifunctional helix-turn-helix transcriptional regulator/GNAT family N-acetyltransferase [Marivita hallyeonensis]|uniref:Transcriptional regulator, MarR family with acetyltransferase activity n=1 Tax=Marivita hallyeonensis TaxID=996342 RepID=A0A1M5PCV5_9RHOB|nr:bifunctional helix-turn-helix transcriptional regulator/GNAT family N-acetyltransferase [Marivita hallyeonensis]SHG99606.1 transcriptional regulator, MarR family with acetyltransferase activity [Marivita hallyeonensis]
MDRIDNFRALTRDMTRAVGMFGSQLAGSDLTLTEVRVFYEIGEREWTGRALAEYLGLDEGYVSRIVSKFERRRWVVRRVSESDRRVRVLSVTPEGRAERAVLVERMRVRAGALLGDVPEVNALHTDEAVGRLRHHLAGDAIAETPVIYRDLTPGESGWLIQRFSEFARLTYGFDAGFEALVAEILVGYLRNHDPTRDRVWIAERAGLRLGTIMCVHSDDPDISKLRLFFVDPLARGQGIGAELVDRCIAFAREAGYGKMVLWTQGQLHGAIRLYERAGFVCVDRQTETDFGQTVENQSWELLL